MYIAMIAVSEPVLYKLLFQKKLQIQITFVKTILITLSSYWRSCAQITKYKLLLEI